MLNSFDNPIQSCGNDLWQRCLHYLASPLLLTLLPSCKFVYLAPIYRHVILMGLVVFACASWGMWWHATLSLQMPKQWEALDLSMDGCGSYYFNVLGWICNSAASVEFINVVWSFNMEMKATDCSWWCAHAIVDIQINKWNHFSLTLISISVFLTFYYI